MEALLQGVKWVFREGEGARLSLEPPPPPAVIPCPPPFPRMGVRPLSHHLCRPPGPELLEPKEMW